MTRRINLHLLAQSHHSRPHLRPHLQSWELSRYILPCGFLPVPLPHLLTPPKNSRNPPVALCRDHPICVGLVSPLRLFWLLRTQRGDPLKRCSLCKPKHMHVPLLSSEGTLRRPHRLVVNQRCHSVYTNRQLGRSQGGVLGEGCSFRHLPLGGAFG